MPIGYTRTSEATIVNGLVASATDINTELNAVEATMNASTGHNHDGTTGGGAKITSGAVSGQDWIVQTASQVVTATASGTTVMPLDNTIPQNTEGVEFLTVAITPVAPPHILFIEAILVLSNTAAGHMSVALFQDTTASALAAVTQKITAADDVVTITLRHRMPADISVATTFKVRAGNSAAGTTRINGQAGAGLFGNRCTSSLRITEIKDT